MREPRGTRDTTPASCIGFASCQHCTRAFGLASVFAPGGTSPPPRAACPWPAGASSRRRRTDPVTGIIRRANTPARANMAIRTTTDCTGASRNLEEHQDQMNVADHHGSATNAAKRCQRHSTGSGLVQCTLRNTITRVATRTATTLQLLDDPNLQPCGAGLQEMWPVWALLRA